MKAETRSTSAQLTEEDLLVGYFKNRVGRNLHSVAEYDGSSWDLLYVREEIVSAESVDGADIPFDDIQSAITDMSDVGSYGSNLQSSVWCFDGFVVLHLSHRHDRNIFVTLEPEAASHLLSVVEDCQAVLFGNQ